MRWQNHPHTCMFEPIKHHQIGIDIYLYGQITARQSLYNLYVLNKSFHQRKSSITIHVIHLDPYISSNFIHCEKIYVKVYVMSRMYTYDSYICNSVTYFYSQFYTTLRYFDSHLIHSFIQSLTLCTARQTKLVVWD